MARRKNVRTCIITTTGADGACSAAMILQADPDAEIIITSKSRSAGTLAAVAETADKHTTVHVCGVGIGDTPEEQMKALEMLASRSREVIWYCGRGYLDDVGEELSARCTAVLTPSTSNTAAVYEYLQPEDTPVTELLLALATEFVEQKQVADETHAWWQDLIEATATRYLTYEDGDAYPTAIRKLAGLQDAGPLDDREVLRWRSTTDKSVPLGRSPAMKLLKRLCVRLAPLSEPVLIYGPTGAGKEMVARMLHGASNRIDGQFIAVNCAVLSTSSDLAQYRLFGHIEGAYTGADHTAPGAFKAADDGTLFLDEIAELPMDVQTQLLRVLEESEVTPLGTVAPYPVNVRVLAATNRDLHRMVSEGRFRADLYYRLNVLTVEVPPLRNRHDDIKSIASHTLRGLKKQGYPLTLSESDWKAVYAYQWPGNIRELKNILKRAAYMKMTVGEAIKIELIKSARCSEPAEGVTGCDWAQIEMFCPSNPQTITPFTDVRDSYVRRCLEVCDRNWALTARRLGIAVNTLRKWAGA